MLLSDNDEGEKFHLNLAIDINGLPFGKTAVSSKYIWDFLGQTVTVVSSKITKNQIRI